MSRRGGRSKRKVETVVLSDDDDDIEEIQQKNTKKRATKSKKQKGVGSKEEVKMDDGELSSDGNEKEFEVESIIGERIESGQKQYHIKWKGFEETTWEPDDFLTNCDELFEEWEQKKIAMNGSKSNEEKKERKEKKEKKNGKKRKEKGSTKEEKRAENDGKQESLLSPLTKRLSMSEQASLIEEKHHQLKRLEENDRANDTSSYEYTNHQVRLSSSIQRSSNALSSPSSSFSSSDAPAPAAASSITADNRMVIESDDSDSDNDNNDNDDDEESYEVEQIIDSRLNGEKYLFKVKWKGWSIDDCTWEPEENLENSKALLLSYLQNNMEQLQYMERKQ